MSWLDIVKEIILYSYYIAGVILAVGIIIAGIQLKMMKKDIQDKNKRSAVQKSIDYLDWMATKFIPEQQVMVDKLKGEKIIVYHELENKSFQFCEVVNIKDQKVLKSIDLKYRNGAMTLANKLEFFSAAIISGLADENLAYNPVANIFCEFVEFNYDAYCYSRKDSTNKFSYTIELYGIWKHKLHNEKVDKQLEQLSSSKVDFTVPKIIGE